MKKIKLLCLYAFLYSLTVFPQSNQAFIKHLSENNLKEEHFHFVTQNLTKSDSSDYFLAKFYLQYKNDSLFFLHYNTSKKLCDNDSLLINYASIYFFKQANQSTEKWISSLNAITSSNHQSKQFINSLQNNKTDLTGYTDKVNNDFVLYKKSLTKKPWLAASLSAVVPGLGKAYIGRKKSFGFTLAAHLLYGMQTYESIKRLGIKNPMSIINIGMFGLMYSSNIYGSYIEAKKIKKERYHQLLYDTSDNLYLDMGDKLYP